MRLIDETYFTGEIQIPNLRERCNGNLGFQRSLIDWETEALRIILGDCLYNELLTQLVWNATTFKYDIIAGADDKWSWLINGKNYTETDIETFGSNTYDSLSYHHCGCGCSGMDCDAFHWDGLIKEDTLNIKPVTLNTNSGDKQISSITSRSSLIAHYVYWKWAANSNTTTTGTGEQLLQVDNAMRVSNHAKRIKAYNRFVTSVIDCNRHGKVGLYRFIRDHSTLFPEWGGSCLNPKMLY